MIRLEGTVHHEESKKHEDHEEYFVRAFVIGRRSKGDSASFGLVSAKATTRFY